MTDRRLIVVLLLSVIPIAGLFFACREGLDEEENELLPALTDLQQTTGLKAELISYAVILNGLAPAGFQDRTGATYKPSHNEDPAIPAQCWIETGYGTQNACKYCHTNYLADTGHGNAFPIAEDQILYSFPSPNLNRVNWPNVTHPEEIVDRLQREGTGVPQADGPDNLTYVRTDNWRSAYAKARPGDDDSWNNASSADSDLQLFPALDPDDLYPHSEDDPTGSGAHGYVDAEGFVRNREDSYTGWRAVNFFPYAVFTPLTGSVSGIYIRLPRGFMTKDGQFDLSVYRENLALLERNIKNPSDDEKQYYGDASDVSVQRGFYPVGTEFAHPLHYVDLAADGEAGADLDGAVSAGKPDYEFPGTRSKRVKEVRYMYKWKDVGLADIGEAGEEGEEADHELEGEEPTAVIGKEWRGWIDNDAGWILAAYIEDRTGQLRPQTTEELLQCLGCHSSVGTTVDAVWSFQRKLPGPSGWGEMDYGAYDSRRPGETRLRDYMNETAGMGELEYFYSTVVGADLFGVMPAEIKTELLQYAEDQNLASGIGLKHDLETIFDDHGLKSRPREEREPILRERAEVMKHYAGARAYLLPDPGPDATSFIKGSIFYPTESTMLANIAGYRRIVLDQSFNLGKHVFGTQPEHVPFTFRSDGTVLDADGQLIPAGAAIESRPWGEDGIGVTPTGIVAVNETGEPVDENGRAVDVETSPEAAVGHVSSGGTFDTQYNPILSDKTARRR
jgi:hypothetical protein